MKKNKLKISIHFIISLTFLGCNFPSLPPEEVKKERLADLITNQVARKIKAEKSLIPIGTGGGMLYQIRMLALSFHCYQPLDINEARELLIFCVNEYTKAVNANQQIQPFLENIPFTDKNVEIRIFLINPDGSDVAAGKLSIASAIKGTLEYDIATGNPTPPSFKLFQEETYEEAVQQLAQSTASSSQLGH